MYRVLMGGGLFKRGCEPLPVHLCQHSISIIMLLAIFLPFIVFFHISDVI